MRVNYTPEEIAEMHDRNENFNGTRANFSKIKLYQAVEKGEYMGKTPNLEQARRAADAVGGALYGITSDGRKVLLL